MSNSPLTVQVDLSPVATSLLLLMPLVWTILVIRRRMNENRARSVSPFKDLRRRPAGESLRLKVAALDEQINDRILMLFSFPFFFGNFGVYYALQFNLRHCVVPLFCGLDAGFKGKTRQVAGRTTKLPAWL